MSYSVCIEKNSKAWSDWIDWQDEQLKQLGK